MDTSIRWVFSAYGCSYRKCHEDLRRSIPVPGSRHTFSCEMNNTEKKIGRSITKYNVLTAEVLIPHLCETSTRRWRLMIYHKHFRTSTRIHQDLIGSKRIQKDPKGSKRIQKDPKGSKRIQKDLSGSIRIHQDPQDPSESTRIHRIH